MIRKECKVIDWRELPVLLRIPYISEKFGIGENEVRAMFKRPDFPLIEIGVPSVEKYALKRYLQQGVKK